MYFSYSHLSLWTSLFVLTTSSYSFCYALFILSNICFAFGLFLNQCPSSSHFLTDRPQYCEQGEVWEATLSPELRARLGAEGRRGSAPVIDIQRANHIAQLHALIQSKRSVSPNPTVPEQSELSSAELHSESYGGFSPQSAMPVIKVSPVSSSTDHRRLSDINIRSPSETLSLPVPTERRHSDLSSLLSLTSHHNHHIAMHRGSACQACISMLHLRSQDWRHHCHSVVMPTHQCPCDFRHHPSPGGMMSTPGYGLLKASSDYSNFSQLQQSLFNIISRKAAPCPPTPAQASSLYSSAALSPTGSDGDCSLKSQFQISSLVGDHEPLQECEDRCCAREQQVTRAVGVVGHKKKLFSRPMMGPKPA